MRRFLPLALTILLLSALHVGAETVTPEAEDTCATKVGFDLAECRARATAGGGGYTTEDENTSLATILGTMVQALLGLVGILFLILTIWGGYQWMTAGGNEERVEKAKKTITQAVTGLVVVLGAWFIYVFIIQDVLGL